MTHNFLVQGSSSPDLPLRILNLFAQRDLPFETAEVTRAGDTYRIRVEVAGLTPDQTGVLAAKMRALVLVEAVTVSS